MKGARAVGSSPLTRGGPDTVVDNATVTVVDEIAEAAKEEQKAESRVTGSPKKTIRSLSSLE